MSIFFRLIGNLSNLAIKQQKLQHQNSIILRNKACHATDTTDVIQICFCF